MTPDSAFALVSMSRTLPSILSARGTATRIARTQMFVV